MAKVIQMTDYDGALRVIVVNAITGVSLSCDIVTVYFGNEQADFTSAPDRLQELFDHIVNEVKHPDGR